MQSLRQFSRQQQTPPQPYHGMCRHVGVAEPFGQTVGLYR